MKFSDVKENDLILYTYDFSSKGLASVIGKVIQRVDALELKDIYTTSGNMCTIFIHVMEKDHRATAIAKVSSIKDAKLQYPEYFI